MTENEISKIIVESSIEVHRVLGGPGLIESVYEESMVEELQLRGVPPAIAMKQFRAWIQETVGSQGTPVFVGFNAPFDWSFVNYYFHRFLIGT